MKQCNFRIIWITYCSFRLCNFFLPIMYSSNKPIVDDNSMVVVDHVLNDIKENCFLNNKSN